MFYNFEVAMHGDNKLNANQIAMIALDLGFGGKDILEFDDYSLSVAFYSNTVKDVFVRICKRMFNKLWSRGIRYIDMFYSSDTEIDPHRITFWSDGRVQQYRTHVLYEEVE